MSVLGRFLQAKDPLFTLALKQLEDYTGNRGIDTHLIGELLTKSHTAMRKLKLDPADTKGIELHNSLVNLIKEHSQLLIQALGGNDPDNTKEVLALVLKKYKELDIPKTGWFLKHSVAKRMLKSKPPVNIMKHLGYTDIDAMLDNEDLYEVFGALRFAEDPKWLNDFLKQYKKLSFSDFEHREIAVVQYERRKWGNLADDFMRKKLHAITHLKELGVILLLPMRQTRATGFAIIETAFIFHYLYEIRLYSSYFKFISVKPSFGQLLVETLIADTAKVGIMGGRHKIHWRVIQRYFGKLKDEDHPEIFEPHVQPEDLHWRKAEEILYQIEPELEFWRDMDYVGIELEGEIVTFNLMDVVLSYAHHVSYQERYLYHFRESLWNEIFIRYMGRRTLEQEVLEQLDNDLIAPEKIKA